MTDKTLPTPAPAVEIPPGIAPKRIVTMDYLIVLGILALWIILQVWVLPKLGVPT
jgi:hypothetical protein